LGRSKRDQVNTPEDVILRRRRALRDRALLISALQKLAVLIVVVAVLFGVIFGLTPMKGDDMEPRLSAGDMLIYYRLQKEPSRNDVVVMKRDGKQYVGRLVGMPGDTLIIRNDGTISIGGSRISETGIFYDTKPYEKYVKYPVTLQDGQYFILADKRDTAMDSRYFGTVERQEIKGKVVTAIRRVSL